MQLSVQAVDRPRVVLVATLLIIALAFLAALNTPVQRTPAITKAVVLVAIPYPDAQPTETENEITRKIEQALGNLANVDFIASTSMRGSSITQIMFLDGVDPDAARAEVQDLVERVKNELPLHREVQPVVTDIDFESMPLMLVTISAPDGFDQRTLKQIAEDCQDDLETVPGVSNTQLFGGLEREIHVNVNPDLMAQYGLTIADLRRSLAAFHAKIPGGSLNTGHFDPAIRNEAKFRGVNDIREAVLREQEGRLLTVADVAEVVDTHRRIKNLAMLDGENCASIIVNKEADINTLGTAQAVKAKVADLRQQYPDLKFAVTRDTSEEISIMFRVLGSSAVSGAILVLVILAIAMGFRTSLLVLLAIPLSAAVGLIFLFFGEVPVSNMVIFSFILVLGMVVDGAIIVAENIHRHIERGEDPETAAKLGIEEVALPVIAADLTTVAAFLPMLLVPGIMGDFMGVMPKVVSVALIGSIMVDHFVIPTLAARWYRQGEFRNSTASHAGVGVELDLSGHSRIRPNLGFFTRQYAAILDWGLSNRLLVMVGCLAAIVGAGFLMRHIGFQFFPPSDRGQFTIRFELPLGHSIDETIAASKVIDRALMELKETGELVHFVSAIGSSEGLASRLENDPATGPEFGTIMVQLLSPLDRDRHEDKIIAQLRQRIAPIPGMKMMIEEVEEGPPGGADVAVRLTGKRLEHLGEMSERIMEGLRDIPGTVDVTSDYRPDNPEMIIEPRPDVVGLFGMTEAQVAEAVQTAVAGDSRIQITLDDEDVTLRLQLAERFQRYPSDLKRLMLTSSDGRRATLGELCDFRRDVGLYSVNRYNRNRAVMPRCDIDDDVTTIDKVFGRLRSKILPEYGFIPVKGNNMAFVGTPGSPAEGIRATFTGENEERDKNFSYLLNSMIIGVILIFAILVLQFNSFRQTLVVLATVPLSFIGVILGMWACGFPFSLASFIGLVALTGIVVNDAIVVVDFTNQARKRGMEVRAALMEAGINRLRPVTLTTVTTCGGLMPLMLNLSGGAEFWQPLTGAIVFGLAFATVLTLLVIPAAYSLCYGGSTRPEAVA
ncbi:MAG: efflux RND transporter permease subunit [Planctomycetales bacterium]|nr:efflux RND transporter permease subunit [Planctomycetales bacterium]